tara:strand:- start:1864 stop:2001 length:138 start_codon:yes stop_codon:yes gene_type:complete
MKKLAKLFLILFTVSTVFTSCRETTGDKVEDAVEDVADEAEDVVD